MSQTATVPSTRAFLAYSNADAQTAGEVTDLLKRIIPDIEIWTPDSFVKPGTDWSQSVREALHDCDLFVLLLSPQSASSPNLRFELGAAWGLGKNIVAITTDEKVALPVDVQGVPYLSLDELRKRPGRLASLMRKSRD